MKLITEVFEDLIVESKGKELFIEGVFLQSNIKNRNGREYPAEIMDKEVERYNEKYVQKNRAFGELGHPEGPSINLERVSHMIKSLKKEGNNYVGKAKIMTETPYGKIVKNLIQEGASLGVSSRGMGSVKETSILPQQQILLQTQVLQMRLSTASWKVKNGCGIMEL